tara:strand:- start:4727 stop:5119 length:393 start_codon:yes stop_codon:yes gene_type:complete
MMMNFALSKVSRFFLALTLTLGMLVSAVSVSVSHLPVNTELAEQARHAELSEKVDDQGHCHDDREIDERHAGHNHGHNPSDHSHETPHLLALLYSLGRDLKRIHFTDNPESNELGAFARLDRPPKSISLI